MDEPRPRESSLSALAGQHGTLVLSNPAKPCTGVVSIEVFKRVFSVGNKLPALNTSDAPASKSEAESMLV